jgi:tyrosyl-DNA phosphodiesterase 1
MNSSTPDTAVVRNDDKAVIQVAIASVNKNSKDSNECDPLTNTPASASSSPIRKRPFPNSSEKDSTNYPDKKKSVSHQETLSEGQPVMEGCMHSPTSPIKLFATRQDEALRQSLDNTSSSRMYDHWSYQHCWTLREMMGLDRFSGISQEGQGDGSDDIGIDFVLVATYILDVNCLFAELPELAFVPNIIIIYEYKDPDPDGVEEHWTEIARRKNRTLLFVQRSPKAEPRTKFNKNNNHQTANPLTCLMEYGCHHTKMFLVKYRSGRLRVNIHTSNLRSQDIHLKCQGAFIQDFLPKTQQQLDCFKTSDFEETLVTYLESYCILNRLSWTQQYPSTTNATPSGNLRSEETLVQHLQTYDFSTAVGVLIPSIPGYHKPYVEKNSEGESLGYLKVQQCIQQYCNKRPTTNNNQKKKNQGLAGPIVCQFSSIGSLSVAYLGKLLGAWNASLVANNNNYDNNNNKKNPKGIPDASFQIVWPTLQEVVTSVEGINGGGSIPGRTKNLIKPFVRRCLHKWRSMSDSERVAGVLGGNINTTPHGNHTLGKGCNVPHIKTYYQISSKVRGMDNDDDDDDDDDDEREEMEWFVLSSHNLSKAAWGEIQNRRVDGRVLVIQHWELGVFVSPVTLGVDGMGPLPSPVEEESTKISSTVASAVRMIPTTQFNVDTTDHPSRVNIPLPYPFRPNKYSAEEQFWATDLFEEG